MEINWEAEVASLLAELSAVQDDLMSVLKRKRECLRASDHEQLLSLQSVEQAIVDRLQACQDRRARLLQQAGAAGLPHDSVRSLAGALPTARQQGLPLKVDQISHRARLLQHHSLTNWVIVQRTLIHLTHLLEIIARGGRLRPTYETGVSDESSGSLVDQAA